MEAFDFTKQKDQIEFYEYFLDHVQALVFVIENNNKIEWINKFAKELFGYDIEAINQMGMRNFFEQRLHPEDQKLFEDNNTSLFSGISEKYISVYRLKNSKGIWRNLLTTGAVSSWLPNGFPWQTVHTSIDISDKFDGLEHFESVLKENAYLKNKIKLAELTNRELEIMKLLAQGFTTQEIADKEFLHFETVKTHKKNIFRKLDSNKIADLVKIATECGLY